MKNDWDRNSGNWDKKDSIEELYDFTAYKPKTAYGGRFKYNNFRVINLKKYRLPIQILISLIILGLVFSLSRLENAVGKSVNTGMKYLLTKEVNIKPVYNKILQMAGQAANMEWPTVLSLPTQGSQAVIAETANPLSLTVPVSGQITTVYGWFISPQDDLQHFHEGVDIQVPLGSEVKSALSGRVLRVGEDKNLGGYVLLEHDQNYTYYAGLGEIAAEPEQEVREGEIIGKVGLNSESRESHLHFEFRERGKPVDPLARLYPDPEPR